MEADKTPNDDVCGSERTPAQAITAPFTSVKFPARLRLFRRRTILVPTWMGSFCLAAVLLILITTWVIFGESSLALTQRLPADILVVEGWIGRTGVRAAVDEFERGRYRYIVASGGLSSGRWEDQPASYAEMAAHEMIRLGVSQAKIIAATSGDSESHRTFESAVAVRRVLRVKGIWPNSLNVFSLGPHARRSAMVFAKVFGKDAKVGVIGWIPPENRSGPWWRSSERSRELLDETVGYLYELLLNSGRRSNVPETARRN